MLVVMLLMFFLVRVGYSLSYDRCLKYQFDFYHPSWDEFGRPKGLLFLSKRSAWAKLYAFLLKRVYLDREKFSIDDTSDYLFKKFKRCETFLVYYLVALCPAVTFGKMLIE